MAKKTKLSEQSTQAEKSVGEILSKTDQFVDKYLKQLLIGVIAVIVAVVAVIAFRHYYLLPKEKNAEAALAPGQNYFASQNWETALNGDSIDYVGFLGVIDEFGGTSSANLARVYAGLCQYQLGAYEEALANLKAYKGKDRVIAAQVAGAIGDCEVNLGRVKESIASFRKASELANSLLLSPIYLQKEALAHESLNNYQAALDIYQTIQSKYPQSPEASAVDKYIERAKALINK
jgi:tetratricopeptide (TPR) repeat protein